MKTSFKSTLRIFTGLSILFALTLLTYYCFYKWRQSRMYEDKITVHAYFMNYACGDCTLDMKVVMVDNPKYNFIIKQDIFPTPRTKGFYALCDYISSASYESSTGENYIPEQFELVGHLHKNPHDFPIFDCSETPYFTVDKIRYGQNKQWTDF